MRLKVVLLTIIFMFGVNVFALDDTVIDAIKKYKSGNYTGCMQDLKSYIKKDPSNALAHYYLAVSYANLGENSEAIEAYNKVLALRPNEVLVNYAKKGKEILEPKIPVLETPKQEVLMEKAIGKKDFNVNLSAQKPVTTVKQSEIKVEQNSKPTDEEIVKALRVLNQAGLNNLPQNQMNPYANLMPQNNQLNELNMLFGNNSNNNNNNAFLNMIPYLMSQQGSNGENKSNISPEAMQAIMLNSMMSNFDFSLKNDK